MKKIALILLLMTILMTLSACNKVVDTTTETVDVVITDAWFEEGETQYYFTGGTMTWSYEPDEYEVDVEYNGKTYKFDDKKIYNKYFEMVGSTVKATLVTYEYDDGTTSTEITELR